MASFLNTGVGTCTLVECPGQNAPPMIIDCGARSRETGDLTSTQAKDYIQTILAQQTAEPNVVISHPDQDHFNLIAAVLADIEVGHVWMAKSRSDYDRFGFLEWLDDQQDVEVHDDLDVDWHNGGNPIGSDLSCGDAAVYVLTVNVGDENNAKSLMLSVEYGGFVAIFTGDAEGETEASAIANFPGANDLRATVLSGSHHGAWTKLSNDYPWAVATQPKVTVWSSGHEYRHPRCEAMNAFQPYTVQAPAHIIRCGTQARYQDEFKTDRAEYVTKTNGIVTITTNGNSPLTVQCSKWPCSTKIPF